jgi:scyllo-inositol 2-dehydrogenase (NADP+)
VAGTWRDHGLGAIQDLGCHLLDLLAFVGRGGGAMRLVAAQAIESKAPDHAVMVSDDGRFTVEVMYHAWRNSFAFELYGEKGSIHGFGLRKWGGSELIVRTRVLPSGRPHETRATDDGPDLTWESELSHFERLCVAGGATDLSTDWWIARTLRQLEEQL